MSKINRNDPCPCGSGKKYKKCCYKTEQDKKSQKGFFRGINSYVAAEKTRKMMKNAKVVKSDSSLSGLLKPAVSTTKESE
jgi:hypothetical protein